MLGVQVVNADTQFSIHMLIEYQIYGTSWETENVDFQVNYIKPGWVKMQKQVEISTNFRTNVSFSFNIPIFQRSCSKMIWNIKETRIRHLFCSLYVLLFLFLCVYMHVQGMFIWLAEAMQLLSRRKDPQKSHIRIRLYGKICYQF